MNSYNSFPLLSLLSVPASITEITGKDVIEGENVTLKCSADGKPTPSIAWMRLSDNIVVFMPLIDISRHDVRKYRCTADNGVGTPATRDVTIDVKCKCYNNIYLYMHTYMPACLQTGMHMCMHTYILVYMHLGSFI